MKSQESFRSMTRYNMRKARLLKFETDNTYGWAFVETFTTS